MGVWKEVKSLIGFPTGLKLSIADVKGFVVLLHFLLEYVRCSGVMVVRNYVYNVVLNQISLVCKVYYKYGKQTLLQKYLDHHGCLERRHDFTKDPSRFQKHCFL